MSFNKLKRIIEENIQEDTNPDERNIRTLMAEEQKAIVDYEKFASQSENPKARKVFLSIAGEERVHLGELTQLLRELGMDTEDEYHKLKKLCDEKKITFSLLIRETLEKMLNRN